MSRWRLANSIHLSIKAIAAVVTTAPVLGSSEAVQTQTYCPVDREHVREEAGSSCKRTVRIRSEIIRLHSHHQASVEGGGVEAAS